MRRFGELEAVIMDRLWDQGRAMLVREMVEDLRDDRALAYTTVMTVMENLHRKGWLRRERDGRAWRYEPTGSRSSYTAVPPPPPLTPPTHLPPPRPPPLPHPQTPRL